jgi:hypothetical protein
MISQNVLEAEAHDQVLRIGQQGAFRCGLDAAKELPLEGFQPLRRPDVRLRREHRAGMEPRALEPTRSLIGDDDPPEIALHDRIRGGNQKAELPLKTLRSWDATRRADAFETIDRGTVVNDAGRRHHSYRRVVDIGDADIFSGQFTKKPLGSSEVCFLVFIHSLSPSKCITLYIQLLPLSAVLESIFMNKNCRKLKFVSELSWPELDLTNVGIESLHLLTVFIECYDIILFVQKFKEPDMVSRKLLLSFVLAYNPAYIVNIKTKTLA